MVDGNAESRVERGSSWLAFALVGIGIIVGIVGISWWMASTSHSSAGYGWGMMDDSGGWGSMWVGMAVTMIALTALFVWLVYLLSRTTSSSQPSTASSGPQDPRAVLKLRYARGELSQEQYDEFRRNLESVGVSST